MEFVVFISTNNVFVLGWQARSSLPLHGGSTSYWIYWRWSKGSSACLSYAIIECWKHRMLAPHLIWPVDNTVTLKGPRGPILAFLSVWRRDSSSEMWEHLAVPKKALRAGGGLLTMVWSDRARGNNFKLKKDWFRLDIRKKKNTYCVRVAKQWHKWSIHGIIQCQVGLGTEQLDVVEDAPAYCRGVVPDDL